MVELSPETSIILMSSVLKRRDSFLPLAIEADTQSIEIMTNLNFMNERGAGFVV